MNVPVHQFLQMGLFLVAISPTLLEIQLNTPVEVGTTWWVLILEHAKLVVTGQEVHQHV